MVCGDANYCTTKKQTFSDEKIKSLNKCKEFNFNPIDALSENWRNYRPRKIKADSTEQIQIGGEK